MEYDLVYFHFVFTSSSIWKSQLYQEKFAMIILVVIEVEYSTCITSATALSSTPHSLGFYTIYNLPTTTHYFLFCAISLVNWDNIILYVNWSGSLRCPPPSRHFQVQSDHISEESASVRKPFDIRHFLWLWWRLISWGKRLELGLYWAPLNRDRFSVIVKNCLFIPLISNVRVRQSASSLNMSDYQTVRPSDCQFQLPATRHSWSWICATLTFLPPSNTSDSPIFNSAVTLTK
jgi:hypothetical protein